MAAPADPALRELDRRVIQLWRVHALLQAAALAAAAGAIGWSSGGAVRGAAAAAVALALGAVLAATAPNARYRAWGFRIRHDDLYLERGILWRTTSVVPHARIQHVDTRRGPFERWLGLARVVVYTAGTTGSAVTLPGLALAEAATLRDRLAALGVDDIARRVAGDGSDGAADDAV